MTGLERKALNMRDEFRKSHNGEEPKFAVVEMCWKDEVKGADTNFIEDKVALFPYDIGVEDDVDEEILFYYNDFSDFLCSLADIDDLEEKYNYEDYAYLAGSGEFTIVDILYFE